MKTNEVWTAKYMDASGTLTLPGGKVGGFVCASSTTGTIAITDGTASGGATIVEEMPVTAGAFVELGFYLPNGGYVTLTSCTGTFQI